MENENKVYAPVKHRNEQYDESRIVYDGNDSIEDAEEAAVAAVKGHIERQDLEGVEADAEEEIAKAGQRREQE
ncbi:hypothetical protein ACFSL6_22010 [Paenibacillus thailandensis]|uniref:DUF4025 domain-containing protein n=1 Tax=Paenibacillus thailandensis TaxID=393250 RepID=A0ABW5R4C4_9BACL